MAGNGNGGNGLIVLSLRLLFPVSLSMLQCAGIKTIVNMIKLLLELVSFLMEYIPFLITLGGLTLFFVLLSRSIKKNAVVYYFLFAIPFVLTLSQFIIGLTGATDFNFYRLPVIGKIMRANVHMADFGYPLLVIIMYVGALNPRNRNVKRLLSVRKEMSIISGFPVLAHSIIRVAHVFPNALRYFTDHAGYVEQNDWIKSDLGVGIANSGYVLGILMLALFIPLWVTSFGPIHRRMGNQRWKRLQRWSYLFYGMLFVHSLTLHLGWLIDRGIVGENPDYSLKRVLSIASTFIVFASYLYLRLKKARKDAERRRRG